VCYIAAVKLLHVIATPRGEQSNGLRVSDAFLESLRTHHSDVTVDVVDLYNHDLPSIAGDNIKAKYTLMMGQPIDKNHAESWRQIELLIEHFLPADAYMITTPMWNLSIPYALKYYIDCIIQPGYVFKYNEMGQAVPLVLGKKMICVSSRGGDYAAGGPMHAYDFQEPYLRAIFGFIGITDLEFIYAQPMDITPALREVAMEAAIEQARDLASRPEWALATGQDQGPSPVGLKPQPITEIDLN
jgi:FMN-dependent NADH-azoreductase